MPIAIMFAFIDYMPTAAIAIRGYSCLLYQVGRSQVFMVVGLVCTSYHPMSIIMVPQEFFQTQTL
jgi:hypothetical protein